MWWKHNCVHIFGLSSIVCRLHGSVASAVPVWWKAASIDPGSVQVCVSISTCVFAGTSIALWVCVKMKYSVRGTLPACVDVLMQMFVKQRALVCVCLCETLITAVSNQHQQQRELPGRHGVSERMCRLTIHSSLSSNQPSLSCLAFLKEAWQLQSREASLT